MLSVIIPVYNSEKTIEPLIENLLLTLCAVTFEIILDRKSVV